jgi:hypothetical protein
MGRLFSHKRAGVCCVIERLGHAWAGWVVLRDIGPEFDAKVYRVWEMSARIALMILAT